jgi:hypothetical protein
VKRKRAGSCRPLWWVPYRLCGAIANRVPGASEQRDQIALYKLAAGVVLFPLTYALVAECDRLAGAFRRAADNRSA